MLYNINLKRSCLLWWLWICPSFLLSFCVADGILRSREMNSGCEQLALQEMVPSTCRSIGEPQILGIALKLFDCRLLLLGKPPLQCSYIRQSDSFACKYPVDEKVSNEILITLLDVFERCHFTFAGNFATETGFLLKKLSSSTKTAQELNSKLRRSKKPLELIHHVRRLQEDAHLVETNVLKKANALKKRVAKVRKSFSNRVHSSNFLKTTGDDLWHVEDCFRKLSGAKETEHSGPECFINAGYCFSHEQVEWLFSVACSVLFLVMIYKIKQGRESAFSALVGILLFAARSYSQTQNYTTFLEHFFFETVAGFSLLAILSMTTANVRL